MARLFVYGSLLSGEHNHHVLGSAVLLGTRETLPEFELVDLGAYPALVRGGRTAVRGELYEVDPRALPALDSFEDEGEYVRVEVELTDGSTAEAYVFHAGGIEDRPRVTSGDWRFRSKG
ncbi:MAG: gamma-glutamylcyclotransferase [Deltaproteobacteria bacterium]|nr:gamma-glutamylcyclotransferase [Deltaproteobacteria bacterium]